MANYAVISQYAIVDTRNNKVVYRDTDLGRAKTYLGRLQAPWEKRYRMEVQRDEVNIYDDVSFRSYCL